MIAVARADRVLVWLKVLTALIGGVGTLLVVFLADVMTARMANPTTVAGIEEVRMSEVEELHHWLGRKIAVAAVDDIHVVHHVGKAFALATDPKQKSALDGILVEHMPAGHFIHTKNILKELLGTKPEPSAPPAVLEAKLAQALMKENKVDAAREQLQHMAAILTGPGKEVAQQALESLQRGDTESAGRLLGGLAAGQ